MQMKYDRVCNAHNRDKLYERTFQRIGRRIKRYEF